MRPDKIKSIIDDYISFIDSPGADPDKCLARILDELALATHFAPLLDDLSTCEMDSVGDAPSFEDIAERFPEYGHFEMAFPFSKQLGDTSLCVIYAIDALRDIYRELKEVQIIWEKYGVDEALSNYKFTFDIHWHWHLRELQLFLHARSLDLDGSQDEE